MNVHDPVLDLIIAYRAGEAAYEERTRGFTPAEEAEHADRIADETYADPFDRLTSAPPAVTSRGAVAALALAVDLMGETSPDSPAAALARSALAYVRGGHPGECPVAALARQAARAWRALEAADETRDRHAGEIAMRWHEAIHEAALCAPTRSAEGALFQLGVLAAEAHCTAMKEEAAEHSRQEAILRGIASVAAWIERTHGLNSSDVLAAGYFGSIWDTMATLAAIEAQGGAS